MLPKNIRLNKKVSTVVKKQGQPYFSPHLKLTVLKDKTTQHASWQIKVFKKTYPLSTDRNAAKRKIREAIRVINPKISIGANIIVQLTKQIDQITPTELQKEITVLLFRAEAVKYLLPELVEGKTTKPFDSLRSLRE